MLSKWQKYKWRILILLGNVVVILGIYFLGVHDEQMQPLLTDIFQWFLNVQLGILVVYYLVTDKTSSRGTKILCGAWGGIGFVLLLLLNVGVHGMVMWLIGFVILSFILAIVLALFRLQ